MSSMSATGGHSAACCNIPPIVTKGYQAKGTYEEIGGYKTCKKPNDFPRRFESYTEVVFYE